VIGAAGEDHLLARADLDRHAVAAALDVAHADGALALEDDAGHMRMGAHIDIAPALCRIQEGGRRADAQPVPDRALAIGYAFLGCAAVVGVARDTERNRALHESFAEPVVPLHGGDGERAVAAAIGLVARTDPFLHAPEIGQHVGIAPAAIAHLRPGVE